MASPLSTFKQMFDLMKRETHHHPEVQYFLSQQDEKPEPAWMDLDVEDHIEKLKDIANRQEKDDDDDGDDDDTREAA